MQNADKEELNRIIFMNSVILFILFLTLPFWLGAILVKTLTDEDVKDYIFDHICASAITLFLLINLLMLFSILTSELGLTFQINVGSGRKASTLLYIFPGFASSYLIFERAFRGEYEIAIVSKFWRFLAWLFLFLTLFGLIIATYI